MAAGPGKLTSIAGGQPPSGTSKGLSPDSRHPACFHTHTHIHTHMCMHMCSLQHSQMRASKRMCIHIQHLRICTHVCMHTRACTYTNTRLQAPMCVHAHIHCPHTPHGHTQTCRVPHQIIHRSLVEAGHMHQEHLCHPACPRCSSETLRHPGDALTVIHRSSHSVRNPRIPLWGLKDCH